jgi:hypothetical protein
MRRCISIASAIAMSAALAVPTAATASAPANPNCWGVVTSQFAGTAPGAVGAHASDPPTLDLFPNRPGRSGLGEIVQVLGLGHVSDLGTFLAGVDEVPATSCP